MQGSVWALAGQLAAVILGLLTNIVISRLYSAEILGIVSLLQTLLGLTAILSHLGTESSLLRLIPEHTVSFSPTSAAKVMAGARRLVLWISLGLGALLAVSSEVTAKIVFSKPGLNFYLALAGIFLVCKTLTVIHTQAIRGLRLVKAYGLMLALPGLANLLLLLIFTMVAYRRNNPVYAFLLALAISCAVGWVIINKTFRSRAAANDKVKTFTTRDILHISLPMCTTTLLFFLSSQSSIIILGMFCTNAQVGYYAIAVKLAALVGFVLGSINAMIAPKFSELYVTGKIDELFNVARRAAKIIFWLTLPIVISLGSLGIPVLTHVFGSDYVAAYPAMLILLGGQFINASSGSTMIFMNMTDHQTILRNIVAISALISISAGLILIPSLGIIGAAIASMLGVGLPNILILLFTKRKFGRTTGYFPFVTD